MSEVPIYNYIFTVAPNDTTDIVYTDPATLQGVNEFVELIDGPGDYGTTGQFLQSNGAGLQWVNGTGSLTDFIQLNDCPNNYGSFSGQSLITDGVSNITYGPIVPEFVQQLGNVNSFTIADLDKLVVVDNTGSSYTYIDLPSKIKNEVVFSDLLDVATPYSIADAHKAVVVNATGNGLEYSTLPIPSSFIGLTDCPASYVGCNNFKVKVNATATGLEFVGDTGGGGVNNFVELDDVFFYNYVGNKYKFPRVNYNQSGLVPYEIGYTNLFKTGLNYTDSGATPRLWYDNVFVNRPRLFFSYSYCADTVSPNNNRGYTNELKLTLSSGSYSTAKRLGKNNAHCFGNSPYTNIKSNAFGSGLFAFNEDSGLLTFTNVGSPNTDNTEVKNVFQTGRQINFKVIITLSVEHSQTPNKDTSVIYGFAYSAVSSSTSSLIDTTNCVVNGSSNNSKPTAGQRGTCSKSFICSVNAPVIGNPIYFSVDIAAASLNNDQNLVAGLDIVNYSWSIEEL